MPAVLWAGVAALPPLTWVRVLTTWRLQPVGALAEVALAGGYAAAVRRTRCWPPSRTLCFLGGVGSVALVVHSFLGVYDDTLFWVRAVQNVVLLMVAPMLLALGAPVTLLRDLLPPGPRRFLGRVLRGRAARVLTFPPVITVALVLPLPVIYFTGLYEQTLRRPVVSGLVGGLVVLVGFVYFWSRFRIDPVPRHDPYGVTLVITVVEVIGDAVLGVVVWLGPLIAAGYYASLTRDWGPALRTGQDLGAGVLWAGGDVVGLPFIAVVHRMAREDGVRAEELDRRLDTEERAAAKAAGTAVDDPAGTGAPGQPRLWWEDHPELAERFRRR